MSLVERWLASEQRHAMSYERWLEYVVADVTSELEAERAKVAELQAHEWIAGARFGFQCGYYKNTEILNQYIRLYALAALQAPEVKP